MILQSDNRQLHAPLVRRGATKVSNYLPICPICTLEDVRHLLLELVAGDAVSDEVKNALAPVLYAVTGLVTDRTMAEQGDGSAHLGGDEDNDHDGVPPRTQ